MFSIKGKIKVIMDEQVISEKFKKRELVLTDDSSQFPQDIIFQLTQDRTSLLDGYKAGDDITLHFNLRGREWTSPKGEVRYFNSLDVWRVEAGGAEVSAAAGVEAPVIESSDDDDLPF